MDKKEFEEFEQRQAYLNAITKNYNSDYKKTINNGHIPKSEHAKNYRSGFTIVGIILSVLFLIELILFMVFSFPFLTIILISISNILNISLFYGLGYALKSIHELKNKNCQSKNRN